MNENLNIENENINTNALKEEQPKEQLTKIEKEKIVQEMGLTIPKNMADQINNILTNYTKRGLTFPKDYNYQNAIINAYIKIQKDPKLKECTSASQASALITMATWGLSTAKDQVYFIPYGKELTCQPSYFGTITAIKRIKGVKDVTADVIYKNTEYELQVDEFGNDDIKIIKPCPLEERKQENIIGAWAKIILDEAVWGKKTYTCIMTMGQIEKSWQQGQMKGKSPAHVNFKSEMCKKSVINRCCKYFVKSARDNDPYIQILDETIKENYEEITSNEKIIGEAKVVDI